MSVRRVSVIFTIIRRAVLASCLIRLNEFKPAVKRCALRRGNSKQHAIVSSGKRNKPDEKAIPDSITATKRDKLFVAPGALPKNTP